MMFTMKPNFSALALCSMIALGAFGSQPARAAIPSFETVVINDETTPVPVVVQQRGEERVIVRNGYEVPPGKRLLIDDITVSCVIASENLGPDFLKFGSATAASLRISYRPVDCPEPLFGEDQQCPAQLHTVGIASYRGMRSTGIIDGRSSLTGSAGRRMAVVAEAGGRLSGICFGSALNLSDSSLVGQGRLVDAP